LWRWIGALVLVVAVIGPFALVASTSVNDSSWIRVDQAMLRGLPAALFGSAAVAAAVVALAIIGIHRHVAAPKPHVTLLASWALVPPALTFVTFPLLHLFHYRYLLFTVPAWIILGAAALVALARQLASRPAILRAAVAGVAVAAIGLAGLPGQVSARQDPLHGYPDYRQAAEIIRSELQVGDGIAFGGHQYLARLGMAYENRRKLRPRDVFLYESAERRGWFVATECPDSVVCAAGIDRIWLVSTANSNDHLAEVSAPVASFLRTRSTVVATWQLPRLRLYLLDIRDGAGPSN
jgi:mannosyltransferase